jgi:hypothetical protein
MLTRQFGSRLIFFYNNSVVMALGNGEHTWLYRTRLGRVRKHEGQPVLEAGASVYRLGPRCRTRA